MLILSRRVGESLVIGENISVTVLRVKGNQVRLGIDAPKDIAVQRQENSEPTKTGIIATMDQECSELATIGAGLSRSGG